MATYSKQLLSGSTSGRPIQIAATAPPGTLLHTAHATDKDEVYIYAVNTNADANVHLTVEFGGVAATDLIFVTVEAAKGLLLVIPGSPLTGGLVVRAFASTTATVNVVGWVNRIT